MKSSQLFKKKINHIAIIMDGNGRWSQKKGVSKKIGHEEGERGFANCEAFWRHLGDFGRFGGLSKSEETPKTAQKN